MDFKETQSKLISSVVSYFALDTVSKQLGTMANLDAKMQAIILTVLGLFLPQVAKQKKGSMTEKVVQDVSDNFTFVGISMLIPQIMPQSASGSAGLPAKTNGGYNWGADSYVNGVANNGNPLEVNQMINGVNGVYPGFNNYVNCPQEVKIDETLEYLADMQGNPIPLKPEIKVINQVPDYRKYCD
jgi:hypothetical protein